MRPLASVTDHASPILASVTASNSRCCSVMATSRPMRRKAHTRQPQLRMATSAVTTVRRERLACSRCCHQALELFLLLRLHPRQVPAQLVHKDSCQSQNATTAIAAVRPEVRLRAMVSASSSSFCRTRRLTTPTCCAGILPPCGPVLEFLQMCGNDTRCNSRRVRDSFLPPSGGNRVGRVSASR